MSTALETRPAHTIRQSNLRLLMEGCPASAWAKAEGGRDIPSGPGAERGTAIHSVFAAYVEYLHLDQRTSDPEAMRIIAADVLSELPTLTHAQRIDVFDQAATIAEQYEHNPDTFYGVEIPLETTIDTPAGPVRITGRLDMLEVDTDNRMATVNDVKSNHRIPPDSEVQADFQLFCYAMLVLDNMPEVDEVFGTLWLTRYGVTVPQHDDACWTREDADALRESIAVRLGAFYAGDLAREFVPGIWCQYCPRRRPGDCTLYRSYYGNAPAPILTATQARKAARQLVVLKEASATRSKALQEWVKANGPVSVGSGAKALVFGYHDTETEVYDADEVWDVLQDPAVVSIVGRQTLDVVFNVDRTKGHPFSKLERVPEIRSALADIVTMKPGTRWGSKAPGGDDD